MRVVVAGAGIFGVTAALELAERGCTVTLVDRGPIPHPLAESTDISKVVRIDYGADVAYTELGERALAGWRQWNATWDQPVFHETGVAFLSRAPMQPGGFEHDSFELLTRRGHPLVRLDATQIAARFPAYRAGVHVDGYVSPIGGWAHATAVVGTLVAIARARGVAIVEAAVEAITAGGVRAGGRDLDADAIVVAAGAWGPRLVPALAGSLRAIGQPVFHLRPADRTAFEAARFPVFGADIARTGYYGFPVDDHGIVKIANHGRGIAIASDAEREVGADQERALRSFLNDAFPRLAGAPIVARRLCVYCDTLDGHFWIARDPDRPSIVVATGGSGHAFKFAPVLGGLIADATLGVAHSLSSRFRWRPELAAASRGDAARHLT